LHPQELRLQIAGGLAFSRAAGLNSVLNRSRFPITKTGQRFEKVPGDLEDIFSAKKEFLAPEKNWRRKIKWSADFRNVFASECPAIGFD
jgi:hypothetical protein